MAYDTAKGHICTLADLHADQKEFPHCIEDGIWVLHEQGVQPGDDMAAFIGYDDHVVEFEITPNRPDCLSVIGLAREAAATFGKELKLHTPEIKGCGGSIADLVDIDIEDGDLCPRYTARMVNNVKIKPSPAWMRERLRNSGVRPINNIVDITNYVMLEYGQPDVYKRQVELRHLFQQVLLNGVHRNPSFTAPCPSGRCKLQAPLPAARAGCPSWARPAGPGRPPGR